jgi:hypothetical protein
MNRYVASFVSVLMVCVGVCLTLAFAVVPSSVLAADGVATEGFGLTQLLALVPDILEALSLVVAGASMIAALTPTPKDDGVLLWVRKAIDFLALNFLGAKNASIDKTFKSRW